MSVALLVALTSLFLIAAPQVVTRTWKSSDGAYSIDAEYVGAKDGKVSLRKPNGTVVEVPLALLSAEDKAHVAEQSASPDGSVIKRGGDDGGNFLELFKRKLAEGESGSLSDALPSVGGNAETAVASQPKKQPIIESSRNRGKRTFLELFKESLNKEETEARLRKQAEAERIADEAAAAKGKENIANRSEFTRGLLRGIDTTQATFYGGLGKLSSAMGDDKASDMRFQQYREQMRQAAENPRLAPTFWSMMDDPFGWLSATTGEYALLTLFCISIFAGVSFWISKLRSRNETERNSEKGIAMLGRNETFFWTREVQDDKVVYTYRNYKIFYFCILPLLMSFTAIPVIGLIPLLSWIFYWGIYPRPNRELKQMLQGAQFVGTGSKLSTENPMRLTFSRADFDRIVMGRKFITPETTQSSTASMQLKTHSDSSSSDAELCFGSA